PAGTSTPLPRAQESCAGARPGARGGLVRGRLAQPATARSDAAGTSAQGPVRKAPSGGRPRRPRRLGPDARSPAGRGPQRRCAGEPRRASWDRRPTVVAGGLADDEPLGGDVLVLEGRIVRRPGRCALALLPR